MADDKDRDGYYRKILPPLCIPNDMLDRDLRLDKPVKIIDKEPDSPAAVSIPFATLPVDKYIRGGAHSPEQEAAKLKALGEKLLAKDDIQQYCEGNGAVCDEQGQHCGYTTTDILPELTGVPLSNLVLAYIWGFNPSAIRVSLDGGVCCDAFTGRVTIMCSREGIVERIYMEISLRYGSGSDVDRVLRSVKEGKPLPTEPAGGTIGHTSGIARANFT